MPIKIKSANYLLILQYETDRLVNGPVRGVQMMHHVSMQAQQQPRTVFRHPVRQVTKGKHLFAVELKPADEGNKKSAGSRL
jgi:hypothetical protein